MRARGRHVKPSRLRNITYTAGLTTAVVVPLSGLTAAPAAAHPTPARATAVQASLVAPAPASTQLAPTLRQGARGAAVIDLQRRLGGLTTDGVFGPMTHRSVLSFQSDGGLVADGIVGPRTWAALNGQPTAARASRSASRPALVAAPAAAPASSRGEAAVAEARRHAGKPYAYGASGPNAFDCSGFVQYVYRQVGVSLPRTSGQQAAAARPVARGSERLGDLIIFRSGGSVSHVGIYAGDGTMWVARRSGTTVTRQAIYTGNYSVGRIG